MKSPRAFITGCLGFAGSHLAEELLANGYEVYGSRYQMEPTTNIEHIKHDLKLTSLDITKPTQCNKLVNKIKPDFIFHLAAMASVGGSIGAERMTSHINLGGTINLLDAARQLPKLKAFINVSSSDCYGKFTPKSKTLFEDQPLNPITPYSITKAAAEQMALYYGRQYDLPVNIARSFNHAGPRQDDRFVIASFAKQVAMIHLNKSKPQMKVGDLSAKRDFSDVRDIVRGYRLLAEKGTRGEVYQFCSGKATSIQTILNSLIKNSSRKITVKIDKTRLRKADIPTLRGSNLKARRELGFSNSLSLSQTLTDTVDYWINRLR